MAKITLPVGPLRAVNRNTQIEQYKAGAATLKIGMAVSVTSDDTVVAANFATLANVDGIVGVVVGWGGAEAGLAPVVGQLIDVCVLGKVSGWASLTAGAAIYAIGSGDITETAADVTAGKYYVRIGVAVNATTIRINPTFDPISVAPSGT